MVKDFPDFYRFKVAVRLNEQTGTITLPVFDDSDQDSPLDLTFNVEPGEGYTVDESAGSVTLSIEDAEGGMAADEEPVTDETPGTGSGLPLVSLNTGPDYLVEADGTVSAHVFNVTGGTIPEGGLLVGVNAPNLSEFDLDSISVGDGGEIVNVREDGFDIRLTDFTVLVDLPVAADGEAEGLETASFSLVAGDGYEVNDDFSSGSFELVDTREEIPQGAIDKRNDVLPLAVETGLSADNPTYTATASIDFNIGNRYKNEDGRFIYVDATEDVDFYSIELKKGDIISSDIDSDAQRGDPPATIAEYESNRGFGTFGSQQIFDSEGRLLESTWLGQGPGELYTSYDGYLEFEAPKDGIYYLAFSSFLGGAADAFVELEGLPEGGKYDPFVPGSGDNRSLLQIDLPQFGEYDINLTLNPEVILELPQFVGDNAVNSNRDSSDTELGAPEISLDFLTFTVDNETDNLVNSFLVEGTPATNSSLVLTLKTEGEIPEEGILVNVNSDNYLERNGFMFGEGNPDLRGMEDAQSGLAFWTRPSDDKLPHLHVDDWNDELGFPIGYSTHEDVSFPTLTVADLIDNGKVGETYLESVQDSLDELGKPIVVSEGKVDDDIMPVFGTFEGDVIEVEGSNQLIFAGAEGDFVDASVGSGSDNRLYLSGGDDIAILGMSDRIIGGAGNDKFFATSGGDNIITGGAGADQFWIATAETPDAANIITDFTSGEDVLGIAGLGIGFDDLSITQQEDNTLIAANNSELAILQGVGMDSLIADNFAFG